MTAPNKSVPGNPLPGPDTPAPVPRRQGRALTMRRDTGVSAHAPARAGTQAGGGTFQPGLFDAERFE